MVEGFGTSTHESVSSSLAFVVGISVVAEELPDGLNGIQMKNHAFAFIEMLIPTKNRMAIHFFMVYFKFLYVIN